MIDRNITATEKWLARSQIPIQAALDCATIVMSLIATAWVEAKYLSK